MPADGGDEDAPTRHRPALQMRHLEDRQGLLAAPIARQDAPYPLLRVPEIQQRQAILAEEAREVVTAVGGDEVVIGLAADVAMTGHAGLGRVRQVGDPDFATIPEAEDEAVAGGVHQADHLGGRFALFVKGRDVGHLFQGLGVEDPHPAGLVIGDRHQLAVLGDGAANGIARLHHAPDHLARQQIHLGEATVAAKNEGVTAIPGEDRRGMGEVPQALDPAQDGVAAGLDHEQGARTPLHDDTQVTRTARLRTGGDRRGFGRSRLGGEGRARDGGRG